MAARYSVLVLVLACAMAGCDFPETGEGEVAAVFFGAVQDSDGDPVAGSRLYFSVIQPVSETDCTNPPDDSYQAVVQTSMQGTYEDTVKHPVSPTSSFCVHIVIEPPVGSGLADAEKSVANVEFVSVGDGVMLPRIRVDVRLQ